MKSRLIKLSVLITVFALGLGLVAVQQNSTRPIKGVAAEIHADNYDPYTYSGDYYDNINVSNLSEGLNGSLRTSLTSLIYPDGWYSYSSTGPTTLSTQLQSADEDPTNNSNMIYLYTRNSVKKNAASSWNREHVWPQSLSNNCWGEGKAGTDILHIRPTYNTTNSTRSNYPYGDTNKSTPKYYDPSTGKTTNDSSKLFFGYLSGGYFEPLESVKGDVARIVMYIWTAYKNSEYEKASQLPNITNVFKDYDTLLKWHMDDRPDVLEGNRNNYSETSKQKNRNPFVDHPEYAWMVFGDSASTSIKQQCMEAYPADGSASKTLTSISITGEATKKNYFAGESFNPTGLTVTGNYDDGSTRNITLTSCTWTPNPLTAGVTSVTCKYNNKTAVYSGITVEPTHEHTFSSEYTYDETYHWHAATCGHDVVSGKERHSFEDVVVPPTSETEGYTTHTCTVCGYSYRDNETPTRTLLRIRVVDNKSATGYQIGEELDLTVTAEYSDNSKVVITDYTVEGFNNRKSGEQSVYVKYGDKTTLIWITVLHGEGEEQEGQPEQPDKTAKRGCSGSITATLSITSFSALICLAFIFSKKKK